MDDKLKQVLALWPTIVRVACLIVGAALLLKVSGLVNVSWSEAKLIAVGMGLLLVR